VAHIRTSTDGRGFACNVHQHTDRIVRLGWCLPRSGSLPKPSSKLSMLHCPSTNQATRNGIRLKFNRHARLAARLHQARQALSRAKPERAPGGVKQAMTVEVVQKLLGTPRRISRKSDGGLTSRVSHSARSSAAKRTLDLKRRGRVDLGGGASRFVRLHRAVFPPEASPLEPWADPSGRVQKALRGGQQSVRENGEAHAAKPRPCRRMAGVAEARPARPTPSP
jgi:hypothetical protein